MAKQDRGVRTRQSILLAAAAVFEERGYDAAKLTEILVRANVTKGALYFHFASKEELAVEVIKAQVEASSTPLPQASKAQEFVDLGLIFAHRLAHDTLLRGSVRLTLDQGGEGLNRSGPYRDWTKVSLRILNEARDRGELQPHVEPRVTAQLLVGAYAGVNMMSQILGEAHDLSRQIAALYQHLMPGIVIPAVLETLDMSAGRGERALAEMRAVQANGAR
ncbi:gamma-butyrolactone-binding protein [Streptomyces abyssalis]|uniref:Gamma-butyrolactone-binding protein n=1 Tax=Streptomyces abyssalis TaxID=933944 RepID=A0A1E7JIM8_9ACTN|nr:ScbR family autoregulator-binding transcription factor [Streptomyces abyssalis]OEU86329.1 gamma-butyrolactone-binding protein [Streptomyces abyssalis]OEU93321.1 gamma-butyrolactone-binding protein [Streptomyces abyssalis]OEV30547.1 gamma-butyrolactone-binding protein [Streptomyces nanshensis]